MADNVERLRPRKPCRICKKPSLQKFHPFCSNRCAQIDLGKWLGGSYAVPVADEEVPSVERQPDE
jgi:uncharacterized protein